MLKAKPAGETVSASRKPAGGGGKATRKTANKKTADKKTTDQKRGAQKAPVKTKVPKTKPAKTKVPQKAKAEDVGLNHAEDTALKGAESPNKKTPPKSAVKKKVRSTRKSKRKATPRPNTIVGHVLNTLDGELNKLEKQEGNKSQDRERASRSLAQHSMTLERTMRLRRKLAKTKPEKGVSTNDKEMLAHAEDLRREIAERIRRLKVEGNGSGN